MSRSLFRKRAFSVLCTGLALAVLFIWSSVWTDLREYEQGSMENVVENFVRELSEAAAMDCASEAADTEADGSEGDEGDAASAADSVQPAEVSVITGERCAALLKENGYDDRVMSAETAGAYLAKLAFGKELSAEPVYMQPADEGAEPVPVKGLYSINADGKPIAELFAEVTGRYGLLDLEKLGIVSVKGHERSEIAVASPERYDLFSTPFLKMQPVKTGYIYKDLVSLSQNTVDVKIPEYYVYELTDSFGAPEVYRSQMPDEPYPLVRMGGVYFVNNHALMELEDDFDAMASARASEICQMLTGELKWENLRGSVLTTAPLFEQLGSREGELNSRQTITEYSEPVLSEHYIWHENLISVRAAVDMTLRTPDGDKKESFDAILYFSRSDNDSDWTLCEMVEQGAH